MSRATPKLTPEQRFLIYELKKDHSGEKVAEIVARGYKEFAPFSVSANRVREVARAIADERGELYDSRLAQAQPNEAIGQLAKRLLHIADRESARYDRQQRAGKLDPEKVGKLTLALTRLHTLLERLEGGAGGGAKGGGDPQGDGDGAGDVKKADSSSPWVAEAVSDAADPAPELPPPPAPIADVRLGANGGDHAPSAEPASPAPAPA